MENPALLAAERLARGYMDYDVTELYHLLHPTDSQLTGCTGTLQGSQPIAMQTRYILRFVMNQPSVLQSYSVMVDEKGKGELWWGWPNLAIREIIEADDRYIYKIHREFIPRMVVDADKALIQQIKDSFEAHISKYEEFNALSTSGPNTPRSGPATPRGGTTTNNGVTTPRAKTVTRRAEELPVVDLSFCDIRVAVDVVRATPRNTNALRVPTQTIHNIIFGDDLKSNPKEDIPVDDDPNKAAKEKLMVKAKNRDGESAAYEFNKQDQRRTNVAKALLDSKQDEKLHAMVALARKSGNKFMTNAVRLSNNHLEGDGSGLASVLSTLMIDACLTLTWVDLSCNQLTNIPDLSMFPLQILHLHQNNIRDMAEVKKLTKLPLTTLTLFGNPLDNSPSYKSIVLSILVPPEGSAEELECRCRLKKFDNVIVSRGDRRTLESFRLMSVAGPRGKTSPRKLKLK